MSIKHMPYGMLSGMDCGFGRLPVTPLAGETVHIHARIERKVEEASLLWQINGLPQASVLANLLFKAGDSRTYADFSIQTPSKPVTISYRIVAGEEETAWFTFETLVERIEALDNCAFLRAELANGRITVKRFDTTNSADNKPSNLSSFICEVKRFTSDKICMSSTLSLFLDRHGHIHETSSSFCLKGDHVYGLGERFDGVDQQGKKLTMRVEEVFGTQGERSYVPVPLLYTQSGAGLFIDSWASACIGFSKNGDTTQVTIRQQIENENDLLPFFLLCGTPVQILSRYDQLTGKPVLPPKWALGIWMSANGWSSQREVMHQAEMCKRYDLPATAIVLEAWSDEKTFYLWNDAEYEMQGGETQYCLADMSFPRQKRWPDPAGMIKALDQVGIKTILWQIPVIKRAWEGSIPQLDADEAYAIQKGYCVHNADGTPYRISDGWFSGSLLLDFSNKDACAWWFGKRRYLLDMGVAGFKTDGGEFLFDHDAVLSNGITGSSIHNVYPMQYIKAYARFSGLTFSRAGYTGAQTAPIHWAGDQWSTWQALKAQLSAGLSAGLSGIPFWSFDLAGFAGPMPDGELYLRALAVAAFCPVMQWHSEPRDGQYEFTANSTALNDRSPWNVQARTGDERIIPCYRKLTHLRMRLMDYLYEEAQEAVQTSRPLMAHCIIDFPADPNVWEIDDAYMLGRKLLFAPILKPNVTTRKVYLPSGKWQNPLTGVWYDGEQWINCECKPGDILVFARDSHAAFQSLFSSL